MTLPREPNDDAVPAAPSAVAPRVDRAALVAIELASLRSTALARAAVGSAIVVALAFSGAIVASRLEGSSSASYASIVRAAARAAAWLVGAPVALAAARDRSGVERASGLEALAAARGASREALAAARHASAIGFGARALVATLAVVGVVAVGASGTPRAALANAAVAVAGVVFAAAAGVALGAVGSACAAVAGARGRSLLALVVVAPWLAADLVGRSAYSLPGALDALLSVLVGAATPGAAS